MIAKLNAPLPFDSTPAQPAAAGMVRHLVVLGIMLASSFFLRCYLDKAGTHLTSFLNAYYPDKMEEFYALSWGQYFLPIKCMWGTWTTTSLLTVHGLEHVFGTPERVFYFTNAVMIVTCYVLSWHVFRSMVFTVTFTLCFAWSTFNHHVYICSGSVALPLIVSYLMFFLFCQYMLMQSSCNYGLWVPIGLLSMFLYALGYESWIDCVTCMWIAYPFLIALAYRSGDPQRVRAGLAIVGVTTAAALAYVYFKTTLGHGQGNGSEADVIFNYGWKRGIVAFEDVVAHLFTLFFITITTYSPPFLFNGSMSSWRYGTGHLIDLQHGYHEQKAHLVGYSHLFLWRFYAGFALAGFLYCFGKNVRSAWRSPTMTTVAISLFLLMTLLSGVTHMLVKYRPMHSAPFLSYHSYFGIVGFSLLLAFAMMWVHTNFQKRWLAWAIIVVMWANLGYCALARPAFLSHMAVECGFAPYPDAAKNLKELMRR